MREYKTMGAEGIGQPINIKDHYPNNKVQKVSDIIKQLNKQGNTKEQ